MLKRILQTFKTPSSSSGGSKHPATPLLEIYELLFCDRPELFKPASLETAVSWQRALYVHSDPAVIHDIAADPTEESRIRLLAYRWLSSHGHAPNSKEILGVVIEVGLESGNDTLAAYADGSARYINQSGKLAVFEGAPPDVVASAKNLIAASRDTVSQIGPWDQPRRPPPSRDDIRLSFLVADGLYFGEGPFNLLANEPLARPVIQAGLKLLQLCVQAGTAKA